MLRFSSNLIACHPLQQGTEIGVKEPQASKGDEQGFIMVAFVSDPDKLSFIFQTGLTKH